MKDILLVRSYLIPEEKMNAEELSIRCAHGDMVIYPLAEIEIAVDGRSLTVEAAVADKLPVSVLLGEMYQNWGCYCRNWRTRTLGRCSQQR